MPAMHRRSSMFADEIRPRVASPMNKSNPRMTAASRRKSRSNPIACDTRANATRLADTNVRNIPARANASL